MSVAERNSASVDQEETNRRETAYKHKIGELQETLSNFQREAERKEADYKTKLHELEVRPQPTLCMVLDCCK